MYSEEDLLPLSALQHFVFCKRQCALIHIERLWLENSLTALGRAMHERVHEEAVGSRRDVRVERSVPLRSLRLGLSGKADVVEFHAAEVGDGWKPFPIEYKRGAPKTDNRDTVQLCAQALCLEEMLGVRVPQGALYYGRTRRRLVVMLDDALRRETEDLAGQLHSFIQAGKTPGPVYASRCKSCSLVDGCLPKAIARGDGVRAYLLATIREAAES